MYDLVKGTRKRHKVGPQREEIDTPRPPNVPPPCATCPKGGPAQRDAWELWPENVRTLELYRQHRAGVRLKLDRLAAHHVALLDAVYREHERRLLAEELGYQVATLLART